jgi:hypothetical protein
VIRFGLIVDTLTAIEESSGGIQQTNVERWIGYRFGEVSSEVQNILFLLDIKRNTRILVCHFAGHNNSLPINNSFAKIIVDKKIGLTGIGPVELV